MKNFLTKTLQFSIKRNIFKSNIEDKRTSFLELFFDLAIVFVFTILARNFANFLGISPHSLQGNKTSEVVSHGSIGLLSWIINFLILWMTWFRFGSFFRRYGRDNFISHLATFLLIVAISFQAIGLGIDSEWFREYGTILSILISSATFMMATWFNYFLIKTDKRKTANISKSINETIIFIVTCLSFLIYLLLDKANIINIIKTSKGNDYWQYSLGLIIIVSIYLIANAFDVAYNYSKQSKIHPEYKGMIFKHNIERHHLLIIISAGESIIFNIGDATRLYFYFENLIFDLVINIAIIMLLWYTYKIFIYRPKYEKSSFNLFLYVFIHILIVAGMLVMASSLKIYAIGQNELFEKENLFQSGNHSNYVVDAIANLKVANSKWYPMIYLSGFLIYIIAILIFISFAKYRKNIIYSRALIKGRKWIVLSTIIFLPIIILIIILLGYDLNIGILYLMISILVPLFLKDVIVTFSIYLYTIQETKDINEAAREIEKLKK